VSHQFIPYGGTDSEAGATANVWARPDLSVSAAVQYEKWDFPILAPVEQSNVTTSVQVTYWPYRRRMH
jgi:hypothetical protein